MALLHVVLRTDRYLVCLPTAGAMLRLSGDAPPASPLQQSSVLLKGEHLSDKLYAETGATRLAPSAETLAPARRHPVGTIQKRETPFQSLRRSRSAISLLLHFLHSKRGYLAPYKVIFLPRGSLHTLWAQVSDTEAAATGTQHVGASVASIERVLCVIDFPKLVGTTRQQIVTNNGLWDCYGKTAAEDSRCSFPNIGGKPQESLSMIFATIVQWQ